MADVMTANGRPRVPRWAIVVVVIVSALVSYLWCYVHFDLREPEHARRQLQAFKSGERGAWDEYMADPPRSARAVPALLDGLRDGDAVVRERSIVGICGLSNDRKVVEALKPLVRDLDGHVREAALQCLARTYHIDPATL